MKNWLKDLKKVFAKNQYASMKSLVLSLCLALAISLDGLSFVSLADVNDLLIASASNATDSNAVMTLDLSDDDYSVSTYSSLASITNTINYSGAFMRLRETTNGVEYYNNVSLSNAGYASYVIPNGHTVRTIGLYLTKSSLPAPGTYRMQFDFSSDASIL